MTHFDGILTSVRLESDLLDVVPNVISGCRRISPDLMERLRDRFAIDPVQAESANSDLTRRYEEVASELERASIDMVALREDVKDKSREALERECNALRERVADLELQLSGGEGLFGTTENMARPDTLTDDAELTAVAEISPALIQWMQTLQDAIGDLRLQMRTAADESVMLETNESVEVISVALSSAVERVETAREAIRRIIEIVGLGE